jgi:hypothetical protein
VVRLEECLTTASGAQLLRLRRGAPKGRSGSGSKGSYRFGQTRHHAEVVTLELLSLGFSILPTS